MWTSLTDLLTKTPMGVTAENLAAESPYQGGERQLCTEVRIRKLL